MNRLIPIEYDDQRILTTSQLAEFYETENIVIQQNYSNNKNRYENGKHFYFLKGEHLKAFKNSLENFEVVDRRTPSLYLWTEKGALLHAKSLGTDKAWEVYDYLVENYFRVKDYLSKFVIPQTYPDALRLAADLQEKNEKLESEKKILLPKAQSYDQLIDSKGLFSMAQVAQSLDIEGLGRNDLMNILRNLKIFVKGERRPYQAFIESGYFKVRDVMLPNGTTEAVTKVTPKGVDYIVKRLRKCGLLPSGNLQVTV